jgi:phage terminase large subunit-like protein
VNAPAPLIDPRPCENPYGCGGRVAMLSGLCLDCGAKHLRPQPGPQETFLSSDAGFALYAGSKLAGKSYALLLDAAQYINTPKWNGVIFRGHAKDLKGSASIFAKAKRLFAGTTGRDANGRPIDPECRDSNPMDIRWPSGATLEFRHLDEKNYLDYQGLEYAWMGFDEMTHFQRHHVMFVMGQLRTESGAQTYLRGTCNPEKDHWLRQWVDYYLAKGTGIADPAKSGRVRYWATAHDSGKIVWGDTRAECAALAKRDPSLVKTFEFIAALTSDNKIGLIQNPETYANIAAMGPVDERRFMFGDWDAVESSDGMLRRSLWGVVEEPIAPIVKRVRAWDLGATKPREGNKNPDYTIGIRMEWDIHGRFYVTDMVACREEPPEVDRLMLATADEDGPEVTQVIPVDPGAAGKAAVGHTRKLLSSSRCGPVVERRPVTNKTVRARPMANALVMGMHGNKPALDYKPDPETGIWLPRGFVCLASGWMSRPYNDGGSGPENLGALFWKQNNDFFTDGLHDDVPDAESDAFAELSQPPVKIQKAVDRFRRLS